MSELLEILGRAITVDTAQLIWRWCDAVSSSASATNDQDERIDKILHLISANKYDSAQSQITEYLMTNPQSALVHMAAAGINIDNSNLSVAVDHLMCVYNTQPGNTMALYALGYCFERLGQEDRAIEFYQDCVKFKRYLQLPHQRLAAIYFKNNQLARAIEHYEQLKLEYINDIDSLVTLGHLYIAAGNYTQAAETFDLAILMHPDSAITSQPDTHADSDIDDALDEIASELSEQPESLELLLKYGDTLVRFGNATEAFAQYEHAVHRHPNSLEARIKLGSLLMQAGQSDLAIEQFNQAVELNDKIVAAYIGLSMAQKLTSQKDKALTTLSLAAAIHPNTCALFSEIAALTLQTNEAGIDDVGLQDALKRLRNAHCAKISAHPENPELLYRLALIDMASNDFEQAEKALKHVLAINPLHTRARHKMLIALYENNRHSEAIDMLDKNIMPDVKTVKLHYKASLLYCDKLKFASTLLNLQNSFDSNLTSTDTIANISAVLQSLGLLDRPSALHDSLSAMVAEIGSENQGHS